MVQPPVNSPHFDPIIALGVFAGVAAGRGTEREPFAADSLQMQQA
jgi:hypothetical protein